MDDARKLICDVESYRVFYDLMPHLLATREGRQRMTEVYVAYRELNARALSSTVQQARSPKARAIAAMHVALTDGLALQVLMDPGGTDVRLAMELWEECVRCVLQESRNVKGEAPDNIKAVRPRAASHGPSSATNRPGQGDP